DDFAANPQLQLADRAGGDYRSDDARGGLHVDFREHVAVDDLLDGAFELVTYVDGLDGHEITPGCVLKRPTQLRGQGGDGFGAFGERRALQHAVQYLGFQRGQGGGAAVAWAWQVDVEVEADGAVLDKNHPVGHRHRFGDIVGHQQHCEAVLQPEPFDQVLHLDAGQRIQRAQRLVQQQQPWLMDQGAG